MNKADTKKHTTGATTLFRQTYLVLVAALILSHLAGFYTVILLPHVESGATTLSGIARQLADPSCDKALPILDDMQSLQLVRSQQPPTPENMTTDTLVRLQLAHVLGVEESAVRLFWPVDSDIPIKRIKQLSLDGRVGELQEVIFLREVTFARQWSDYWCVGAVQPAPWQNQWQVRIALTLLVSLSALLVMAWLFTRRLSRPIHEFAAAADAIGRDHQAPLLEENGPQEMRIAARALNAMQLRIQDQLREREALVAAIAHDLRTPLSRIAFRVETASPVLSDSVQRDIEQMNAMISTTLEFAREGQQAPGEDHVDLKKLLESIAEAEQAIGNPVELLSNPALKPVSVLVKGDELQFIRLFQNLIDNAIKFGELAEISLEVSKGDVVIKIADRGPGIDPAQLDDMFRPFSRGEPSRNPQTGGIGLGLAITRSIARKHGGDIQLSNSQMGLVVTVTLPTCQA